MISMTGYGQNAVEEEDLKIKVEIKSYNHRFCEITVRMPRQFLHLEDQIKKAIQNQVSRGKVDVFVTIEGNGLIKRSLHIDWELLNSYITINNQLKEKTDISSQLSVEDLLFNDQIVTVEEEMASNENVKTLLIEVTKGAVGQLMEMRKREGQILHNDLKIRIEKMRTQVESLKKYAPDVAEYYRERLLKRVEEFADGRLEVDESRILTEVAMFADKSNIDEEIIRLDSHFEQFLLTMEDGKVMGRKLDFLVQEMNREVNTIGAKANDIHISRQVVELKSEIEKVKEQVQNIE